MLNSGTNEIKFTTARGSYSIEQINVVTDLKETKPAKKEKDNEQK